MVLGGATQRAVESGPITEVSTLTPAWRPQGYLATNDEVSGNHLEVDHGVVVVPEHELRPPHIVPVQEVVRCTARTH